MFRIKINFFFCPVVALIFCTSVYAGNNSSSKFILLQPSGILVKKYKDDSTGLNQTFEAYVAKVASELGSTHFAILPISIFPIPFAIVETADSEKLNEQISREKSKGVADFFSIDQLLAYEAQHDLTKLGQTDANGVLTNPQMKSMLGINTLEQAALVASLPGDIHALPDHFTSILGVSQLTTAIFSFAEKLNFIANFLQKSTLNQSNNEDVNGVLRKVNSKLLQILEFFEPILDNRTVFLFFAKSFELGNALGLNYIKGLTTKSVLTIFTFWLDQIRTNNFKWDTSLANLVFLMPRSNGSTEQEFIRLLSNLIKSLEKQRAPVFRGDNLNKQLVIRMTEISIKNIIDARLRSGEPPYTEAQLQAKRENLWQEINDFSHIETIGQEKIVEILDRLTSERVISTISFVASLNPGKISVYRFFAISMDVISLLIKSSNNESLRAIYVNAGEKLMTTYRKIELASIEDFNSPTARFRFIKFTGLLKQNQSNKCLRLFL